MQLTNVKIENFRAHSRTELPLTQLGSLIGENNAGKSSVLHALQFVLEDRRLYPDDFRDPSQPVTVALTIENICDDDLLRISETHRSRVAEMLVDGVITIVRSQEITGRPESKYLKLMPRNRNLHPEVVESSIKNKKNPELRQVAVDLVPELGEVLSQSPTQKQIKDACNAIIDNLSESELTECPVSYSTGIAQAVKPLLPSVIYIEAVKDASIEAKSTGTSAFSKLLELLFEEVSEKFNDINQQFQNVSKKLNRFFTDDGEEVDERLSAVKRIESTIEGYVRSSFPGVSLRMNVPAPTLSMLLTGAELRIDDGHDGSLSSKGDGLKRTVLFALLRAYADIKNAGLNDEEISGNIKASYVLLFEEPELYLHPRAQRQLMAALETFSHQHQVLVTTHSPGFFRPDTKGFARLQKTSTGVCAQPIDLTLELRDAYQIVQHENNEAAFFAQKVVLVEGDSDTFTYPHLARVLSPDWDDVDRNIMFIKIGGKGNITRYRKFFEHFQIPIHVIADLDALSNGFNHLTSTGSIKEAHSRLMDAIGKCLTAPSEINSRKVRQVTSRGTSKDLWVHAQMLLQKWNDAPTPGIAKEVSETLSQLFDQGKGDEKLAQLENPSTAEIEHARNTVIAALADEGVYVLRRGDLETYCGTNVGQDKVATAIRFCDNVKTNEDLRAIHGDEADSIEGELRGIFANIYS